MNYKQMIEQARANGMATEKKMWAAVETLSTDLLTLEQTDPKLAHIAPSARRSLRTALF